MFTGRVQLREARTSVILGACVRSLNTIKNIHLFNYIKLYEFFPNCFGMQLDFNKHLIKLLHSKSFS